MFPPGPANLAYPTGEEDSATPFNGSGNIELAVGALRGGGGGGSGTYRVMSAAPSGSPGPWSAAGCSDQQQFVLGMSGGGLGGGMHLQQQVFVGPAPEVVEKLSQWSVAEAVAWLEREGLGEVGATFQAAQVDGDGLLELSAMLHADRSVFFDFVSKDIGVKSPGIRLKLARKIASALGDL